MTKDPLCDGQPVAVGVDVGGTKIAAGLLAADGRLVARDRAPTDAGDPDAIVTTIARLVAGLDPGGGLPVGVACAGYLDADRAVVQFAPNLAWRRFPLAERLSSELGRAVVLENDANAAAVGEHRHGAGRGARALLMITLGTGVGGAVVLDGRLLRGAFGSGAELGHTRVEREGRPCPCGLRGCLEAYSSGSALARSGRELLAAGGPAARALGQRCARPGLVTAADVVALARAGDEACSRLVGDVGRYLGEALGSLANAVDPDVIVLGGGLAAVPEVLEPVAPTLAAHLTGAGFRPHPRTVRALLGDEAGMIGAAVLAGEEIG